ncbi:NADH-ubiquinone oxidoreductase subunit NDUFA12 family protein [Candidatus Fokinia crypta]|uniref:NADH dehydrogenase subunit family protein n=1 Tax=Candidatus Fokinia crypta TaxID=1920990 RepID=A0ABZ0USN5_9RICK|nr:NADH-ubiquinone oxidoreductase subunit NDUFA12 family protein [Candidatus Fokinia cryptica]WPX98163.1 NADH dehydrogenase subunit family protein [Candidatus Fokinia cryptica]
MKSMNIFHNAFTRLFSTFVSQDKYGNKYYTSKKYLKYFLSPHTRRWVIYSNFWGDYFCNEPTSIDNNNFNWLSHRSSSLEHKDESLHYKYDKVFLNDSGRLQTTDDNIETYIAHYNSKELPNIPNLTGTVARMMHASHGCKNRLVDVEYFPWNY